MAVAPLRPAEEREPGRGDAWEPPPPTDDDAPGGRGRPGPNGTNGTNGTGGGPRVEPDLEVLECHDRTPPPFPLDVLAPRWAEWCSAAAEGAGAPVDYVAGALLAVAAAAVGAAVRVVAWRGWPEPIALWIALLGSSGQSKSPAIDPFSEVLSRVERVWRREYDAATVEWDQRLAVAKVEHQAWERAAQASLRSGERPPAPPAEPTDEPRCRRLRVSDTTPEALARVLEHNPHGVLVKRDELAAWLGSFGRYTGASGGERALWIELYGARDYVADRVSGSVYVPRAVVSILGTTQPERLESMLLSDCDDGLAARFLWCWPSPMEPKRPHRFVDLDALERALLWLRSFEFLPDERGDLSPTEIPLTDDAADLLQAWRCSHYAASHGAQGFLASALNKGPGVVLRLAGLLALLDVAGTTSPSPTGVSREVLARAIRLWDSYFVPMAVLVYGDAAVPESDRDATTLAGWIERNRPETINARKLRRSVRLPGLTESARVNSAIGVLVDAGWLAPAGKRAGGTSGRTTSDYMVRPEVYEALATRGSPPSANSAVSANSPARGGPRRETR